MTDANTNPVPCGCGRSATGFGVGLHAISDEDWDRMLLEGLDTQDPDEEDDPL